MQAEELRTALDAMTDPSVAKYQNTVISDTHYPMRHIRTPELRKLAKSAGKGDWKSLVSKGKYETFEEVLTIGLAVAYGKAPFEEKIPSLRLLLPRLDSWAMTDPIAATLKWRAEEAELAHAFARECLESPLEYTVRFGILMLMYGFLTPQAAPDTVRLLCGVEDPRYYVQMAVAWCFAELGVREFPRVEEVLRTGTLPLFTHNMTIRKLRESYRISPEQKAAAARWKRKEERT